MNPPALLLVWYVEDFCYKVEMAEFQIKVLVNKLEFITFVWCCYIFAIPDSVAYTAWCTLDFFFQFIFFWLYTCLWKPMLFVSSTCEEESCFRKQAPNPTQPNPNDPCILNLPPCPRTIHKIPLARLASSPAAVHDQSHQHKVVIHTIQPLKTNTKLQTFFRLFSKPIQSWNPER